MPTLNTKIQAEVPNVPSATQPVLKILGEKVKTLAELFKQFEPISLEDTNKSAKMLKRFENKYVVERNQFEEFLSLVIEDYAILEIEGTRQFSYSSCYYDDNFRCYTDHLHGRRLRFKARTREYVDSGLMFFEMKIKVLRGRTDKHRIKTNTFSSETIGKNELDLLTSTYEKNYQQQFSYNLSPNLIVDYKRCTLVSRRGGERVTIDFSLAFTPSNQPDKKIQIGEDFIIIETKSGDGKGLADSVMKDLGIRQASKCSKYCLGVNLSGLVKQNNSFIPMLKQISASIVTA